MTNSQPRGAYVFEAAARVSDDASVRRLLEPFPDGEEIRERLGGAFFSQKWDRETNRDYWVGSDGETAICITISGLSLEQGAMVRAAFDDLVDRSRGARVVASLISMIVGGEVSLTQ